MQARLCDLRFVIAEALEDELELQIAELAEEPEFSSVEDFVQSKMDNEEDTFSVVELQALSRATFATTTGHEVSEVPFQHVKAVRDEVEGYGLRYVPRAAVRKTRGHLSSAHGTHPFAGSGGGGTGFGSGWGGMSFTSFGGGPGAVGGGYKWDPNDPKNLAMGSKRRKRP